MNAKEYEFLVGKHDVPEHRLNSSVEYRRTKREINRFCKGLSLDTKQYLPEKTIKSLQKYINAPDKLDRLLYSEISHIIFQMDEVARGNFVSNAEELLMYVLRKQDPRYNDIRKIAVKIYDHAQLVTYQVENIQNMFNSGIDDAKLDLEKTIQGVEKEYVSILGIFASVILAFVGGMTFSTSVLNNIAKASIFRLLIVTDLLAFVLFNTIIILLKFIFVINDSRQNFPFSAKFMNIILLIFALFILISWCFSLNDIPSFLLKFFPWGH